VQEATAWRGAKAWRATWTARACSTPPWRRRRRPALTPAPRRRIAQCFDSVSVCFSKGLGAPVGSALCGSQEFIARAHRIRKMAGGGMRQAGVLAAAASHALDHHIDRLADDHALARRLADGLAGLDGVQVEPPHTNIVFVDLTGAARDKSAGLLPALAAQGIQATGLYRCAL
jgi:threonine aldolase